MLGEPAAHVGAVEVMQSEAGLTQRERKSLAAQKDQEDVNKESLVRVAADDIPRIPVDHLSRPVKCDVKCEVKAGGGIRGSKL